MFKIDKTQGFSIVEVVIAAVIFSITALGLFSIFSATRQVSDASEESLVAAYKGYQVLEDLRSKVDQRTWSGNSDLSIGVNTWTDGIFTITRNVTIANGTTGLRRAEVTISWNET